MKFMVSGSRYMARCDHPGGRFQPCAVAREHRRLMDTAMREHVHPVAASGDLLELWHGDAPGADKLAGEYWVTYLFGRVHAVPANWAELGGRAGHVRNGLLVARMPDLLLAFPWVGDGNQALSPGTRDAIAQAAEAGIRWTAYPLREICPEIKL